MAELFPPTLADEIRRIEREIAMRLTVYPRRVSNGLMKQDTADREIALMRAVLARLRTIAEGAGNG